MVGKPNLPDTGDRRPGLRGAARPTPGMAALDEEREASMADEGGASGAVMESEDPAAIPQILGETWQERRRRRGRAFVVGAAAGLAAAVWMVSRRRTVTGATLDIGPEVQNPEA